MQSLYNNITKTHISYPINANNLCLQVFTTRVRVFPPKVYFFVQFSALIYAMKEMQFCADARMPSITCFYYHAINFEGYAAVWLGSMPL